MIPDLASLPVAPEILLMLALIAGIAGFVDAVAGGGGLLTIPALMFAGLNPVQAVATNKLQAVFGSFSATRFFVKEKLVKPSEHKLMLFITALGAIAGALAIQAFDSDYLLKIMPFAFMFIAAYLLFSKNFGKQQSEEKISPRAFTFSAAPAIGAYDGFFGPATGTFFTLGFTRLRGMNLIRATAHAKLLNFTTNIVSLTVFIASGSIVWLPGLVMATGQFIGARLGAAAAITKGTDFIRYITIIICISMSVHLIYRNMS